MPLRPRCGYAAGLPRSLPLAAHACRPGSSPPVMKGGCAPPPSPDLPDSSWRLIKGLSHTGSSRTPLHPARRTRHLWQYCHVPALSGLLPPFPAPPGSGCPQLRRPAATGTAVKVSHLHSNQQRLTAHT